MLNTVMTAARRDHSLTNPTVREDYSPDGDAWSRKSKIFFTMGAN